MAKTKGDALVASVCKLLGWPNTGDYATRALACLNEAQQSIDQLGSLHHLQVDSTVSLANALDYVEVSVLNPAIDTGKQVTLRQPGGRQGAVTFLDRDKFAVTPIDSYGAWDASLPSYWTWSSSGAGAIRILFDRTNATGGPLVFPISYQRVSPAIVNDNASESTLPEGYELSLLVPFAEILAKKLVGKAEWKDTHVMLFGAETDEKSPGGRLGRFLDQYGARKEEPRPDREQLERANARKLSEGT